MSVRRWDGAARQSTEWDGLRRVRLRFHFLMLLVKTDNWSRIQNCGIHKAIALSICTNVASLGEVQLSECQWMDYAQQIANHY